MSKIFKYLFLTLFAFVGLWILWGWIQAFMAFDVSDEAFKRDHYKWKLEGMHEYKCLCQLFDDKHFKGKVVSYEDPLGAGSPDIIVINIDRNSDSVFLKDCEVKDYAGHVDYIIKNGKLTITIGSGQGPQDLLPGDNVYKLADNDSIVFEGNDGRKTLNPYHLFEGEYTSCAEVDTMNVRYNLCQFIKYDSLSRVSRPLDHRTLVYMNNRIKEQTK